MIEVLLAKAVGLLAAHRLKSRSQGVDFACFQLADKD
jgi:hypothetical protein